MVSEGGPVLTEAIDVLASGDSLPAVMHCSAGKDRTGVLSALVLAFLGVPDETIVEDYALSAAAMERLLERLKAEYPEAADEVERYAPAILHVVPETMEQFLAALRLEYGTYDELADALGVAEAVDRCGPRSWSTPDRPSGTCRRRTAGVRRRTSRHPHSAGPPPHPRPRRGADPRSVGSSPCPASSTRRNSM